jgi:N-methylhydantoinase A
MLLPAVLEQVHAAEVIVPPHPGLFSALGLVSSDLVYADSRSAYTVLAADAAESVDAVYRQMEENLRSRLAEADRDRVVFVRTFDGRLLGQTWETPFIEVPPGRITADAVSTMVSNFHKTYAERSGNMFQELPVQGVTYRVHAVIHTDKVNYPRIPRAAGDAVPTRTLTLRHLSEKDHTAAEYQRADLLAGHRITGPAVLREATSTTFLLAGQVATVGDFGELKITRVTR